MIKKVMEFFSQHIILANVNHTAGGFGLALILQHYLVGNPFLPVAVGWVLVGFYLVVHIYAWTR